MKGWAGTECRIGTQVCRQCKITKPLLAFHVKTRRKLGRSTLCKDCTNRLHREIYDRRPERIARKAELEKTPKVKAMRQAYRAAHPRTEYSKIYEQNYRERRKQLHEYHQATDPQYRLRRALRARLKQAMKNDTKLGSAIDDLGCSILYLRRHLEVRFIEGMSWDNYGRLDSAGRTWQIDHFLPLSRFDLTNDKQRQIACHYSNLRPLWAPDNRRKGNKTVGRKEVPNGR